MRSTDEPGEVRTSPLRAEGQRLVTGPRYRSSQSRASFMTSCLSVGTWPDSKTRCRLSVGGVESDASDQTIRRGSHHREFVPSPRIGGRTRLGTL